MFIFDIQQVETFIYFIFITHRIKTAHFFNSQVLKDDAKYY